MCLSVDYVLSQQYKDQNITAYKVLKVFNGKLYSPYYFYPITLNNGFFYSNREDFLAGNTRNVEPDYVEYGIHVCLTLEDAEKVKMNVGMGSACNYVIVKCQCYKEDFVAAGNFGDSLSAVYDKVHFNQEDIDKALKENA